MGIAHKIKKQLHTISSARKQPGKNKFFLRWFTEMIIWYFRNSSGIVEYFLLGLIKKESRVSDFIQQKPFTRIHNRLNRLYYRCLLEDKYVFDKFLAAEKYPVVPMVAHIEMGKVRLNGKNMTLTVDEFLDQEVHCFCKMHTNCGGEGVFKIDSVGGKITINNQPATKADFHKIINGEVFVLQETAKQHPAMDKMNPNCVNTIRIITIDNGGSIEVFATFIRIGVGKSVVDNLGQGNLGCGIHPDGTLFKEASDLSGFNKWITHHPDTKAAFEGFQIPYYPEAMQLCCEMHDSFKCFFIIGWDIVITPEGPMVIEGNPVADINYEQSLTGPLKKSFMIRAKNYQKKYPNRK